MDLPPEARALLALPPQRFTAARNALAAALAARGDPAAARVRKLGRPRGVAWLLNRLARERPAEARDLLSAGERLHAGQRRAVSGAGPEALRAADAALREAARALRLRAAELLAAEGRPAPAALLARVELLLRLAATGPGRAAFREASLEAEPAAGGELSGFEVVEGGRPEVAAPAGARPRPAAEERRRAEQERRAAERVRRERERALARARAEAARARETAAAAERRAREARERADRLAAAVRDLERGARS
jgi:hypothetical protein